MHNNQFILNHANTRKGFTMLQFNRKFKKKEQKTNITHIKEDQGHHEPEDVKGGRGIGINAQYIHPTYAIGSNEASVINQDIQNQQKNKNVVVNYNAKKIVSGMGNLDFSTSQVKSTKRKNIKMII